MGKSSYYMLIQSAMDARGGSLEDYASTTAVFNKRRRAEFWKPLPWQQTLKIKVPPFIFPEDDLFRDLINLYFTRHNPFFPLLHQPTFERLVAEGLHLRDRSFGATVLAVCAIASRQSNDPRAFCEGTTSEHSLGWKYFQQIPLIRDSFTEPPTLYDIQLYSLAVYFLQTASTPEAAWTLVGVGVRSAQEMGFNRRNTSSGKTVEDELWKRALWILVTMDLFMCVPMGRPRATTPTDFDCELPSECDDEYWENPDPGQAFVQPQGKPSVLSFFVMLLKLLNIADFAQRTLYPFQKTQWSGMGISGLDWKQKAVIELDSALNQFMDQIPDHLKWDPKVSNHIFFQQSAMLYSTYHWVQIQVHRPFIPRPGQEPILPFPSLAICSSAARKIIHILETMNSRVDRGMIALDMGPYPSMSLLVSALILLVNIWRQQRQGSEIVLDSKNDLSDVYRCVELMRKSEARYQTAGRLGDILTSVITIGQLPWATHSFKRPRSPHSDERCTTQPGPRPSHLQVVPLEDLHGIFRTESYNHDSMGSNPLDHHSSLPYHRFFSPSVSYLASGLPSTGPLGVDPLGPSSILRTPIPGGGETRNSAAANDYILSQPTPATSSLENVHFTQEDWNSFMFNVDDIVNGAVDYRWFEG
ncbi:Gypsy retrotransposon integrase-like protein 1 [Marasmius sp. AFHP31]|nr:Gypsy retrotransposon integrase-like protein 1 [Marasmius sp. AFHP31]